MHVHLMHVYNISIHIRTYIHIYIHIYIYICCGRLHRLGVYSLGPRAQLDPLSLAGKGHRGPGIHKELVGKEMPQEGALPLGDPRVHGAHRPPLD